MRPFATAFPDARWRGGVCIRSSARAMLAPTDLVTTAELVGEVHCLNATRRARLSKRLVVIEVVRVAECEQAIRRVWSQHERLPAEHLSGEASGQRDVELEAANRKTRDDDGRIAAVEPEAGDEASEWRRPWIVDLQEQAADVSRVRVAGAADLNV